MTSYRSIFSTMFLVSSLAGFAAPALADSYHCAGKGEHGDFFEHRGERMEQHQKKLLEALKLSPDQEPAWKKFIASDGPMPMSRAATKSEDWTKLTAPERAEKRLDMMKERQVRMGEHVAALKEFYAVLTPEQRKTFDDFHGGSPHGMHGMRHHRHSGPERAAPR
jgi:Spy/CpxP family protein refolding chaperone